MVAFEVAKSVLAVVGLVFIVGLATFIYFWRKWDNEGKGEIR